ncbi:MAG: hypothetical protein ACI80S_002005 [Pseudohongiellaceae bacterium]|jgi:hypothetical protein
MTDKRQFFRIQQNVIFNFKAVAADSIHEGNAEQHFNPSTGIGLLAKFQQLDKDSVTIVQNIRKDNSDVGDYLEVINQKINLLSQQILAQEIVTLNRQDADRIDLSQGGIAFSSSYPLSIESWIAIKLVFLPAYTVILSYAQITRCQKSENDDYLVGARFDQLNDEEQRIIAKQVIDTQILQKLQSKR